jgi:ABC-type multidrug transport system ATPase subunit
MIELEHLVKKFGDLIAVNDVSLKIARGEFFAMLGPNAAGKTTTIKLLAGLMKPTSGHARICGFDIQSQPLEARQRLAYVPDFPFLYDKLTAWEFFRFTGQLFQLDAARIEKMRKHSSRVFIFLNLPIARWKDFLTARANASPSRLRCCMTRKFLSLTNPWSASTRNTRASSKMF